MEKNYISITSQNSEMYGGYILSNNSIYYYPYFSFEKKYVCNVPDLPNIKNYIVDNNYVYVIC